MFKIVAFDMDGTIADTIPLCIEAFRNSVSPYTDHELSNKEILQTFGLNEIGMIKAVVGKNWEFALNDFYFHYESLHKDLTNAFPDILNLILFLKSKKVTVVLITGKGEKSCAITLKKLGLSKIFDQILYGSKISPNKKENMKYILKKHSISKEEFCYIGDTIQDIEICQDIGVACLTAAWQKSADIDILKKENPDHVFRQVKDLYEYLKQRLNSMDVNY